MRSKAVLRARSHDTHRGQPPRAPALPAPPPGEYVIGVSALALHGLPLYGVDLETVHLAASVRRTRRAGMVRLYPRDPNLHPVVADGYRIAPVADSVLRVVREHGLLAGLVPFDAALHRGMVTSHEVREAASALDGGTMSASFTKLLSLGDPACESPGETRTRVSLLDLGLPDVRSQVEIRDGGRLVARVDILVAGRVVVEFDGRVKYGELEGRDTLIAEKRREDELRRLGYEVVRLTWSDLDIPGRVARLVRAALARVGVRSA